MIRTEYRKWRVVPHEQEDQHIVRMKSEGDCVLEKLRESEAMMIQKRKQLREMFQELMVMSQEPYVVLLQVRREECRQRFSCLGLTLVDVILRLFFNISCIYFKRFFFSDNLEKLNSVTILPEQDFFNKNCVSRFSKKYDLIFDFVTCHSES